MVFSLEVEWINSAEERYFSPNLVRVLNSGGQYEKYNVSKKWKAVRGQNDSRFYGANLNCKDLYEQPYIVSVSKVIYYPEDRVSDKWEI